MVAAVIVVVVVVILCGGGAVLVTRHQERIWKPGSFGPSSGAGVLRGRAKKISLNAEWKSHYWVPGYDEDGNAIPRQRRIELKRQFRDAAKEGRPAPDTRPS